MIFITENLEVRVDFQVSCVPSTLPVPPPNPTPLASPLCSRTFHPVLQAGFQNSPPSQANLSCLMQGAQRSLCPQMFTLGVWDVKPHRVVPSRGGMQNLFSAQKAGGYMLSCQVMFLQTVWPKTFLTEPPPDPFSLASFSQSVYRTHLYGRTHMYFTKNVNVVTSNLYLATLFLKGFQLCLAVHS